MGRFVAVRGNGIKNGYISFFFLSSPFHQRFHHLCFRCFSLAMASSSMPTINIIDNKGVMVGVIHPQPSSTVEDLHKVARATADFFQIENHEYDINIVFKPKKKEDEDVKPTVEVEKKIEAVKKWTRVRLGDWGVVKDFEVNMVWRCMTLKRKLMNYFFGRVLHNTDYDSYALYFKLSKRTLYIHGSLLGEALGTIVGDETLLDIVLVRI